MELERQQKRCVCVCQWGCPLMSTALRGETVLDDMLKMKTALTEKLEMVEAGRSSEQSQTGLNR